jgi:hypothetical protein
MNHNFLEIFIKLVGVSFHPKKNYNMFLNTQTLGMWYVPCVNDGNFGLIYFNRVFFFTIGIPRHDIITLMDVTNLKKNIVDINLKSTSLTYVLTFIIHFNK